jgi:hypothetical protein
VYLQDCFWNCVSLLFGFGGQSFSAGTAQAERCEDPAHRPLRPAAFSGNRLLTLAIMKIIMEDIRMQRRYRFTVAAYLLCSLVMFAQVIHILLNNPSVTFGTLINLYQPMVALVSVWLLTGLILFALAWNRVNKKNSTLYVSFIIVALVYANFFHERMWGGDMVAYVDAATAICRGEHFTDRYPYPPMLASILAVVQNFGGLKAAYIACYGANMVSLWVFFFLAVAWLRRFGVSLNLASIMVFFAVVLNVPILTNLGYTQVNLVVADLMLGSLLLYPRFPIRSALLLALGVHMKIVPLVFAPLFLGKPRWKWWSSFCLSLVGVVALTSWKDGFGYYGDFLSLLKGYGKTITPTFSSSIDTWVRLLLDHLVGSRRFAGALSIAIKSLLLVLTCVLALLSARRKPFVKSSDRASDRVINGCIPLFFLTIIFSPLVWAYHLTWLIAPTLALALTLRSRSQSALFFAAYFAVFVVPAFDLFPWAIVRLAGWLGLYAMVAKVILCPRQGEWWIMAGEVLERSINLLSHHSTDQARMRND